MEPSDFDASENCPLPPTGLVGFEKIIPGPKVINLLERALGKALFADESYRLGDGQYASCVNKDAAGKLANCIKKPRYAQKMVIVRIRTGLETVSSEIYGR